MLFSATLLVASATPVIKVCIVCCLGALLARQGVLDKAGRQNLSVLVYLAFAPSLTFSKLAAAVSLDTLKLLWPLPLNIILNVLIGSVLGLVVGRLLKAPKWFRTHIMLALGCGNVGNIPLVLVATMCADTHMPFHASIANCEEVGIAYVALGMTVGMLCQFVLAYNLLKRPSVNSPAGTPMQPLVTDGPDADNKPVVVYAVPGTRHKHLGADSDPDSMSDDEDALMQRHSSMQADGEEHTATDKQPQNSRGANVGYNSAVDEESTCLGRVGGVDSSAQLGQDITARMCPRERDDSAAAEVDIQQARLSNGLVSQHSGSVQLEMQQLLNRMPDDFADEAEDAPLLQRSSPAYGRSGQDLDRQSGIGVESLWSGRRIFARACLARAYALLKPVLTMPTYAAALGLLIGCTPWLKAMLFGDHAPLAVLIESTNLLGQAMIPGILLVLGSVLWSGPMACNLERCLVVADVVGRLIIMPATGLLAVMGLWRLGAIPAPDKLFLLVMLIQTSTPTAINIQTVATMHSNGEAEMSVLLFWQYLASILTMPLWIAIHLSVLAA